MSGGISVGSLFSRNLSFAADNSHVRWARQASSSELRTLVQRRHTSCPSHVFKWQGYLENPGLLTRLITAQQPCLPQTCFTPGLTSQGIPLLPQVKSSTGHKATKCKAHSRLKTVHWGFRGYKVKKIRNLCPQRVYHPNSRFWGMGKRRAKSISNYKVESGKCSERDKNRLVGASDQDYILLSQ